MKKVGLCSEVFTREEDPKEPGTPGTGTASSTVYAPREVLGSIAQPRQRLPAVSAS